MRTETSNNRGDQLLDALGIVLAIGVGIYFRFVNLEITPGYYSDEGTLVEIAHHLLHGRWQYMALNQSTLLVARMPLFPLMLAGVSSLLGEGIHTLRILTASLGVISIILTYALSRRLGGRRLAFAAALILAIHPMAVIYSRLGFSYNLLAVLTPLVGIVVLEFLESSQPRQLLVAGLLVGIGAISDLLMTVYMIPIALIASTRGRRTLAALALGFGLPTAAYGAYMFATAAEAFIFDLQFTLSRLGGIPVVAQFPVASLNYALLLELDPWFIPAIFGVFLIHPRRSRWFLLLLFILPLLLVGRSVTGLAGLGYYYLIPVLPYAAIAIAAAVLTGLLRIYETLVTGIDRMTASWGWSPTGRQISWLQRRASALIVALILFVLAFSPFVISGMKTVIGIRGDLETPIDFLLVDQAAAEEAAAFVNARTRETDLVIASPAVAWLIDSRVSEFQLSLAASGKETIHFPLYIPAERLEYDATATTARYVIVDGIWRNWAAKVMPGVDELLEELQAWPLQYQAEDVEVYENPNLEAGRPAGNSRYTPLNESARLSSRCQRV